MRCQGAWLPFVRTLAAVVAVALLITLSRPARATIFQEAQPVYEAIIEGLSSDGIDSDFAPGDDAATIFAKANCKDPKFPLVCVKDGSSSTLGVKETCKRGGKKISCGAVHWSAKVSHPGLKAEFSPDPGDPTTETITAAAGLKPGTYSQVITVKCSAVPACVGGTAPIVVLK
jgi:hypothetical protein